MSKSKTAIAEIKRLMVQFGFMSDEPTLQSFKLEDNTIVETPELKAGEKITKLNEEFERVALESGSYRLVENFNIDVEDGEIKSVKQIFLSAKLVDGTEIKVEGEELVPGAKVVVVTPDAEVPAPDGKHELEDKTKVETKDGVIVSVEEAMEEEGEGEPAEEGEVPAPVNKDAAPVEEEVMSLLKEFIKKMSEKMVSMESQLESVKNDFNAFKKEPAAKPIANGKTDFNKQEITDDVDAKIAAIMSLRNSNK
jgi:hypothetical protein